MDVSAGDLWLLAGGLLAAPLCAVTRVFTLLAFGSFIVGVAIPWRYLGAFSALVGLAVAPPGSLAGDSVPLAMACEVALGAALGTIAGLVLQGIRIVGQIVDDHALGGLALPNSVFEDGETQGPAAQLVGALAVLLVVFGGTGGEMPVVEAMLASFRDAPAGSVSDIGDRSILIGRVLGTSLELAVGAALPIVAALSIVDWCQTLISRGAPLVPAGVMSTAVRPLLALAILVATFGNVLEPLGGVIRRAMGVS